MNASSRQNYGDSAIGYVCVKGENYICTVKAKVCPEHQVRNKAYSVIVTVNEENELIIINVKCQDCAASSGGCNHAIAFVMWIHRRSEDPSPTDVQCYWKKPVLANIGTPRQFIEAKDFPSFTKSTIMESMSRIVIRKEGYSLDDAAKMCPNFKGPETRAEFK
ncbi:Uncharacterized protein DBV15_11266 [Temnothorax longispinosus]|uniref:SWIM-type domain-containing protein n=1 Tax=Temnothorax longispinosus TaxID=300112 RepID=A0A4V3SBG1_9HYME|nr:Uncharacterized protein DBV15_11266 [Temnothorax longispinosus]